MYGSCNLSAFLIVKMTSVRPSTNTHGQYSRSKQQSLDSEPKRNRSHHSSQVTDATLQAQLMADTSLQSNLVTSNILHYLPAMVSITWQQTDVSY